MSQSFSLRWLIDFAKAGFSWIAKNPLLIVLVIIIVSYNEFVPQIGVNVHELNIARADSIWRVAIEAIHFFTSGPGIVFWLVTFFCASGITIFNAGVMLAVIAGKLKPGKIGIQTLLSRSWIEYGVLQLGVSIFSVVVAIAGVWFVVRFLSLIGLAGSVLIGIVVVIGYPIMYMVMSVAAILCAVPVSVREKIQYVRVLLKRQNISRLTIYYLIRMGGEALIGYIALLIAHTLQLSGLITSLIIVAIIVIPYALIRTTGLLIKLDMLCDEVWFSREFLHYYQGRKLPKAV